MPIVDQEYLRKDDQTEHGEEHDHQHERHAGSFLQNASVRPASAGTAPSGTHPPKLLSTSSEKLSGRLGQCVDR